MPLKKLKAALEAAKIHADKNDFTSCLTELQKAQIENSQLTTQLANVEDTLKVINSKIITLKKALSPQPKPVPPPIKRLHALRMLTEALEALETLKSLTPKQTKTTTKATAAATVNAVIKTTAQAQDNIGYFPFDFEEESIVAPAPKAPHSSSSSAIVPTSARARLSTATTVSIKKEETAAQPATAETVDEMSSAPPNAPPSTPPESLQALASLLISLLHFYPTVAEIVD